MERDVYGWDATAPTQKKQVSCDIHLKENREKEGKTQLTRKKGNQISGKGREKGVSRTGQPTWVCKDNCSSEHGSVYTLLCLNLETLRARVRDASAQEPARCGPARLCEDTAPSSPNAWAAGHHAQMLPHLR